MSQLTDDLFVALSNRYRRQLLAALLKHDAQTERAVPEQRSQREADREHVQLKMRYTHLPKLEDMGFVDWNQETGTITRGPQFDAIRPYLQAIYDNHAQLPAEWF